MFERISVRDSSVGTAQGACTVIPSSLLFHVTAAYLPLLAMKIHNIKANPETHAHFQS
jgi:hypothetical protein